MYQQQQQEHPPEKNRNSKDTHTRGPACRPRGGGHWLIATTAGQTVPDRDQALHDSSTHTSGNSGCEGGAYTTYMPGSAVVGGDRAATTQQLVVVW